MDNKKSYIEGGWRRDNTILKKSKKIKIKSSKY